MLSRRVGEFLLACLLATSAAAVEPEQACADCHGKDGASTESDVPIIGGLSEQYLLDAMAAYRGKTRPCPESKFRAGDTKRARTDMCRIAAELGEAGAATVAKHLAAEPFVRARQASDPAKAAHGKKLHDLHCEKCHADGGASSEDDSGVLAGQWMPYLRASMKEFTGGARPVPEKMKPKIDKLTGAEIDALVHYYGSQQ
jgi:cytochrome subunit of sulfide dehydrogenase